MFTPVSSMFLSKFSNINQIPFGRFIWDMFNGNVGDKVKINQFMCLDG